MAYTKTTFNEGAAPGISAAELNKIGDGIAAAASTADSALSTAQSAQTTANTANTTANAALPASSYTAADVLAKVKTVDGAGSGLDADTVDGIQGANIITTTGGQTIAGSLRADGGFNVNGTQQAQTRLNGSVLEFWNGSGWTPVGGIKSVQRGTVNFPSNTSGTAFLDITISTVNTAKTFVNVGNLNNLQSFAGRVRFELINSTTIRAPYVNNGGAVDVTYEVIESY
ncbi:hypothetical protein [Paenibacillus sp. HJGM_3]|uniref:hypothetical protein n=1 Tax=Paenibacillus sp. HJGM_3 TaxID=3379816 RepID=UPI00385FF6ED